MRVLLVDDEPRIHDFVREALIADGIDVESATDGRVGMRRAVTGEHDLIVLDLMLPGASGLAILRAIRAKHPSMPVLILSARADLPVKLRGFELGATDYLTKPFAVAELLARVRVQLSRAGEAPKTRVGGLELDLVSRRVRVADGEADLSDREFTLLRCLADHVGEVVSRERLLAEVWGMDFDPGTNLVDVCVRRVRRKLGPAARIITARNAGYSLVSE